MDFSHDSDSVDAAVAAAIDGYVPALFDGDAYPLVVAEMRRLVGLAAPLLSELAAFIGEPVPNRPRYDRESFNEGEDLDGDCIRTRHEVLIEEATDPVTMSVSGCSVAVGGWYDPFTGRSTSDPRDLQVDHVVSLSDAWHSGAWAWSWGKRPNSRTISRT